MIGALEFLTKLQRILSEGLFVASYKYALLLALAELSVEKDIAPDGTLRLELKDLAERFIVLYWRQAAPFAGHGILAQNNGKQASVVRRIAAFKEQAPTLALARVHPGWPRLVKEIGRLLVVMPLWKLQRVGDEKLDFLYAEELVDRGIVLRPGVAACFRAHFPLVQALVQGGWLAFVQRLPANHGLLGSATNLEDFLFGAERSGLRIVAEGLRELQSSKCFYCGGRVGGAGAVDHFIPWSRYPLDLGHNLVLAHAECNADKRDMLAAGGHLERWIAHVRDRAAGLQQVFETARFPYDLDASLSVAEWSYENAERAGALVWVRRKGQTARLAGEWRRWFE